MSAESERRTKALLSGRVVLACVVPCGPTSPTLNDRLSAILETEELARANRFRFAQDRTAFVAAHALARVMLSGILARPARNWEFETNCLGRPLLSPGQSRHDISFSISHTRGLAACAVGASSGIGIDVENSDAARLLEVDGDWLTSSETAALDALTPEARKVAAIRLWTLKEAVAKATGHGLGQRVGDVGFVLDPPSFERAPAGPGHWRLAQMRPTSTHVMAVAVRSATKRSVQIAINSWSIANMLEASLFPCSQPCNCP